MKLDTELIHNAHVGNNDDFVTARVDSIMPGTHPMPVSLRMVRAMIGLFRKAGAAHTLSNGAALWVYIEWCQLNHIPYTLDLHHTETIPSAWIIRVIIL